MLANKILNSFFIRVTKFTRGLLTVPGVSTGEGRGSKFLKNRLTFASSACTAPHSERPRGPRAGFFLMAAPLPNDHMKTFLQA